MIILSIFIFITEGCGQQTKRKQAANNDVAIQQSQKTEQQAGTVTQQKIKDKNIYFSYRSSANIIFSIFNNSEEGVAIIAGEKHTGVIKKNKYDEDVYDFHSNGKCIFIFQEEDGNIIIVNQNYEINGANEKAIELFPVNRPDNMTLLYSEGPDYIIDSIPLMNNKAYYLGEAGAHIESIYILKKVLSKRPDRVVAYLNLADSYWEVNNKKEAKVSYQKYIKLMQIQGKDMSKIPQRVYDRIK